MHSKLNCTLQGMWNLRLKAIDHYWIVYFSYDAVKVPEDHEFKPITSKVFLH